MRKIFLVTDYACNNACISCAKKTGEKGYLSFEEIVKKIDCAKPTKEDHIEISGGEPTLRIDFLDICRYIKANYEAKLIILSNGRKFKDMGFAKCLKEVGVDRVMTTFYSPYKKVHDEVTMKRGSFSEAVEGLKNLERIGVPISVKTIILHQNYRQLPTFVRFAYDTFPSAWVSIHGLIMRGHAKDNKRRIVARYRDIKPYLEQALDIAIERDKNLGVFIIPTCTIDPFYWQYLSINWKEMTQTMVYISPEETVFGNMDVAQLDHCSDCFMRDCCSWAWESAWKEYVELFGTDELNKVTCQKSRCVG